MQNRMSGMAQTVTTSAVKSDLTDVAAYIATHAIRVAQGSLPQTPWACIKYLHEKLCQAKTDQHVQRVGRALMQLILTGSFDGCDLFESSEALGDAPLTALVPKLLCHAQICFRFAETGKATAAQTTYYCQVIASLVKRNLKADDYVRKDFSHLARVSSLAHSDVIASTYEAVQAKSWLAPVSTTDRHTFLALWLFAVISEVYSKQRTNISKDLLGLRKLSATAGFGTIKEFVDSAL
jgi:hypothetical protein